MSGFDGSAYPNQTFAWVSLDGCKWAFHPTGGTALPCFGGHDDPLTIHRFGVLRIGNVQVGATQDPQSGMAMTHQAQGDRKVFPAKKAFGPIDRVKHPVLRRAGVVPTVVKKGEDIFG